MVDAKYSAAATSEGVKELNAEQLAALSCTERFSYKMNRCSSTTGHFCHHDDLWCNNTCGNWGTHFLLLLAFIKI